MTLTKKDVNRINSLGYSRDDYARKASDGFIELRNNDGYCYFYDRESRSCKIYDKRPEGCRYYPIVYNLHLGTCVADRDCPSADTVTKEDIRRICPKVKELVRQLRTEAIYDDSES
ncbi:MAG: YkgJ family cysteine cluster protein [Candidatus Lokiarchaeota archaeon]|nr:YkgJ family cysteine cluster protein [Candidatus Lokiarchaeota archaeon]